MLLDHTLRALVEKQTVKKRTAFSSKYPRFKPVVMFGRRTLRTAYNYATIGKGYEKAHYLNHVIARHASLLFRKLGDSDHALQINKIQNLKVAIAELDGIIIPPGGIFSFWHAIGEVNRKRGFVDGMLLSDGNVVEGLGGGLCQLSNFLYWIFLHADTTVVERYHHSRDVFPDSGRTLPFGGGATVFYNYFDLKIKNVSSQPLQIKLWLTKDALKGQLLSSAPCEKKFHVYEKNHWFIKRGDRYFRYNEIYRDVLIKGIKIKEEKIVTNFAPVLYAVEPSYLAERNYYCFDLSTQ